MQKLSDVFRVRRGAGRAGMPASRGRPLVVVGLGLLLVAGLQGPAQVQAQPQPQAHGQGQGAAQAQSLAQAQAQARPLFHVTRFRVKKIVCFASNVQPSATAQVEVDKLAATADGQLAVPVPVLAQFDNGLLQIELPSETKHAGACFVRASAVTTDRASTMTVKDACTAVKTDQVAKAVSRGVGDACRP